MKNSSAYMLLEKHMAAISKIGTAQSLMHWDMTQNTPEGAQGSMAEDIGNLTAISHNLFASDKTSNLIYEASSEDLDDWQKKNLELIKKSYTHATALSADFVEKFSILTSKAQSVWQKAKSKNDWEAFLPYLTDIVKSVREMAKIKSEKLGLSPYDSLLDEYDPERKSSEFQILFDTLKGELPNLIQNILEKQRTEEVIPITEKIDPKLQKEISIQIMKQMHFDFDNGRIDEYEHPFCTTTSGGVRILSKFLPDACLEGILATIHETGHSLYEQNLSAKYKHQLIGKACGMSIHESQSLFMELQVARSRAFADYLSRLFKDEFAFKGSAYEPENLYKLLNRVKPIFIRVNSDEVTYPLHVILRFEIELALLDGSIEVSELPGIWNEKMKEYFGIVPSNYKEGVMQDVHWSGGSFGYFPCYVGGSVNASMLANAARNAGIMKDDDLRKGDLRAVSGWLKDNIWENGSRYNPSELIERASGVKQMSADVFLDYLRGKFL